MRTPSFRKGTWAAAIVVISVALLIVVALWPVETRFGRDFQWSTREIRLYEKAIDFVSRHRQTHRLVDDLVGDQAPGKEALLTIFEWVGENVRPTPAGFPVIDDHPWHIIIRGYGETDQRTEAFALLASYAGMPTSATTIFDPAGDGGFLVAIVRVEDDLYVFDIANQVLFLERSGGLATVDRIVEDPATIHLRGPSGGIDAAPYEPFFSSLDGVRPDFSRMEMQKPIKRFVSELSNLFRGGPG